MKITNTDGIKGSSKSKKAKSTGDKGVFDALLGAGETSSTSETKAPAAMEGVAATSAFLAMQEVPHDNGLRQQTLKQGVQSLDMLEALRRDMLLGDDSPHMLQRMREQQNRLNSHAHDPMLKDIINDIDVRLAVEIAKREASFA